VKRLFGQRLLAVALLAAAVSFFMVEAWPQRVPPDDSFISFRYARNLAAGQGLVFNPGERVEGITNLLWTLLLGLGIALGGSAPAVAHVLDLVAGSAALLAAFAFAGALLPPGRAWVAGLAPLLLLAGPSFTFWSTAGMGTTLFVALVTATFTAQARGWMGWATLGACLATLARPEGALTAAIVMGFHLLWKHREGWRAWREPGLYALFLLLLTGFRLAYYGAPVPNTFYAKVGGIPVSNGLRQVGDFLAAGAAPLLVLAVAGVLSDRRTWPAAVFVAAMLAYVVSIGGDVFSLWRFLLAPLALLVGIALLGSVVAFSLRGWLLAPAALLLALSFSTYVFGSPARALHPTQPTPRRATLEEGWKRRCLFHNMAAQYAVEFEDRAERGEPIQLVAVGAVGAIGYYSELPVLDIFGITDAEVARKRGTPADRFRLVPGHIRSNADYVLSRRPDYLLVQAPDSPKKGPRLPAFVEISEHPDFQQGYEKTKAAGLYRRKDLPPAARKRRFPEFWSRLLGLVADCNGREEKNAVTTTPETRGAAKGNVRRTRRPRERSAK